MSRFSKRKKIFYLLVLTAIVSCIAIVFCSCQTSEDQGPDNEIPKEQTFGETDPEKLNDNQDSLMKLVPQYFGLDASNGLDVYVWQMAKNSYRFGLLTHKEGRDWKSEELFALRGVSYQNMREILATYNIDEEEIYIVPWFYPLSSYIGDYFVAEKDETAEEVEAKRKAYVDYVREMLFSEDFEDPNKKPDPVLVYSAPVYSYVIDPSLVPSSLADKIDDNEDDLYNGATLERLGSYKKIELTKSDFLQMMGEYGEEYSQLGNELQQNNNYAYEIHPPTPEAIDLYYVLEQNDKSMLLVYGHYENGEKTNEIRWIFDVGKTGIHFVYIVESFN